MYGEIFPDPGRAGYDTHTPPTVANIRDHFIGSVFQFSDTDGSVYPLNTDDPIPGNKITWFYYNAGPTVQGGSTGIRDMKMARTNSMNDLLLAMQTARPVNMGQLQNYFTNAMSLHALLTGREPLEDSIAIWQSQRSPYASFARDFHDDVPYDYSTLMPEDPSAVGPFFGRLRDGFVRDGLDELAEAMRGAAEAYYTYVEVPYSEGEPIGESPSTGSNLLATLSGDTALPDSYGMKRTAGQWLTRPGEKFYKKPIVWIGTGVGVLGLLIWWRKG